MLGGIGRVPRRKVGKLMEAVYGIVRGNRGAYVALRVALALASLASLILASGAGSQWD